MHEEYYCTLGPFDTYYLKFTTCSGCGHRTASPLPQLCSGGRWGTFYVRTLYTNRVNLNEKNLCKMFV